MTEQSEPTLHIFPQPFWHEQAVIVGNRDGLEKLYYELEKLLYMNAPAVHDTPEEFFTTDGEGYGVHMVMLANDDPRWLTLQMPYSDEDVQKMLPQTTRTWLP